MEDRESSQEIKPKKNLKAICVGAAAAALLMLLGAMGFRSLLAPAVSVPSSKTATVALVDVRQVMEAHAAYGSLIELKENELVLREELKTAMTPIKVEAPKVPDAPFQDSVWQKNAQNVIGTAAEIIREKKRAAQEYRESTEAEYQAKRDEIDGEYLNAILNIQLKLQNKDVMRLSQEAVDELIAKREALQAERGARQMELAEKWEADILAYSEEAVREKFGQLQDDAMSSKAELEMDAAKKQAEAQERNAAAMDEIMQKSVERQQLRLQIFQELQETIKERIELESHMLSDIAGQAAKLAIMHHYTLIIASPAQNIRERIPWRHNGSKDKEASEDEYMPVVGSGTDDLTEELLTEIRKL